MEIQVFGAGGYRYIPAVFQYSGGVAAEPGFRIERVMFRRPVPLAQGFRRAESIIKERGRPLTAFCACELRSARPFSDQGFREFNEHYVQTLAHWGIYDDEDQSGGAQQRLPRDRAAGRALLPRICVHGAVGATASRHSSSPAAAKRGRAERPTGSGPIRYGETGDDAMREKALFVLGEMERRLGLLGQSWATTTATQVYTVHDLHPFFGDEIVRRGAAPAGLTWHFCRPPVQGLEYEMDCRGVAIEHFID